MGLTLALSNAISGLTVSQQALATTSHNIANANTEGYSRQLVDQSARLTGGVGNGAQIDDVVRKVDVYLQRAIRSESSTVGYNETIDDYYDRLQILFGEPGSQNSIDEYVEDFFNALQSLAETPNFSSFQATAVDTAEVLAREISGLAYSLEELRYQADQDIDSIADFLNGEMFHLKELNLAINRADALGASKASLFDDRDNTLKAISEYLDIDIYLEENGRVNVTSSSGISLVDENLYEFRYTPMVGVDAFINDAAVSPLEMHIVNEDDGTSIDSREVISSGIDSDIVSYLKNGTLEALHQLRDVLLPDIVSQLDELSARLRDEINAIHNDGSGIPGADTYTGTRLVSAHEEFDWSGEVMIQVLDEDGAPVRSVYDDEAAGFRPLTLDLSALDSGYGAGVPTTQTIIDEINYHFNAPPIKAVSGNLNNIQLVSNTTQLPSAAISTFDFDFELDNISATEADFWVTNVTVLDDTAANITSFTDTVPRVAVDPANAYSFTAGSRTVTITTSGTHGLVPGDRVYMEVPGGAPAILPGSGVASATLNSYFEVIDTPGSNTFTIQISSPSAATVVEGGFGAFDVLPPWQEVPAGSKERARDNGLITADLSGNQTSIYYDITADIGVYDNDSGQVQLGTVTYRVYNNTTSLLNDRYDITPNTSTGSIAEVYPDSPHQYLFAKLVDEDGVELRKSNGSYGEQEGYLQLVTNGLDGDTYTISIDELDSQQLGTLTGTPQADGTNRGLSHYYELNNFFASNVPSATGDTVAGSAINLAVEQRLLDDPGQISTGDLQRSVQSADPDDLPVYTYERFESDNSVAQRLAGLANTKVAFDLVGGLPAQDSTFSEYAGEFLGFQATAAASYAKTLTDSETLLSGFEQQSDEFSGVNLDEELANTIIYQNAYAASARVITVTDELFDALLSAV